MLRVAAHLQWQTPKGEIENCWNKLVNETSRSSKADLLIREPTSVIKVNKLSEKCSNTNPGPTHTYKDIYTCIHTYIYMQAFPHMWTHIYGCAPHTHTYTWKKKERTKPFINFLNDGSVCLGGTCFKNIMWLLHSHLGELHFMSLCQKLD